MLWEDREKKETQRWGGEMEVNRQRKDIQTTICMVQTKMNELTFVQGGWLDDMLLHQLLGDLSCFCQVWVWHTHSVAIILAEKKKKSEKYT
eukprot:m.251513 g.251513  ORF g.251513 m.251513 type:complete len:91 (+) comp15454_c0_seq2:2299-2571(+)